MNLIKNAYSIPTGLAIMNFPQLSLPLILFPAFHTIC